MDHTEIYEFCKKRRIRNLEIKYSGELATLGIPSGGDAICELEIAQDDLIKLIEFEIKAKTIIKHLNQEKELRDRYASVQNAYDEYQLLLAITQKEQQNES